MTQLALQQKLHNPVRQANESFEVYQQRRKSSHELNKLAAKGRLWHRSLWFTTVTNNDGSTSTRRHHSTFKKEQ
ncbi:hypothetical protein UFOVP249_10 [uncultured Caudovirales phage]|uniref:Uncharacterized protein n=1 Tax=uncultured Caudovirales phage TaxID=2100421 RepID=A0A6J5LDM2_9CAUD|nr:hypothetical protein UFOVP249_10 [uncultured Caudovirales phage]